MTVKRRHLHNRSINVQGFVREDGLWEVEGRLYDTKTYDFDLPDKGRLHAAEPLHHRRLPAKVPIPVMPPAKTTTPIMEPDSYEDDDDEHNPGSFRQSRLPPRDQYHPQPEVPQRVNVDEARVLSSTWGEE